MFDVAASPQLAGAVSQRPQRFELNIESGWEDRLAPDSCDRQSPTRLTELLDTRFSVAARFTL
jgi:hypothetical protein